MEEIPAFLDIPDQECQQPFSHGRKETQATHRVKFNHQFLFEAVVLGGGLLHSNGN